ncbi:MAG: nidogen-like domain-containing protein [Bacteroidota bacterium]
MKHLSTIITLCLFSFCYLPSWADCPVNESVLLVAESFENGLPQDWSAPQTRDGENWRIDALPFGFYGNPGSGQWIYVNDEKNDKVGSAELLSATYDLSTFPSFLQLEFDLNFQEYSGLGYFQVEVRTGDEWKVLLEDREDVNAHITIDITDCALAEVQFRFRYFDEDSWGWGMGIDNFQILGLPDACGNGICDYGETPESCEDCVARDQRAEAWISSQTDLRGEALSYKSFNQGVGCDDCYEEVELGFSFEFFEESYDRAFINANGNITFDEPYVAFTPEAFCLSGPKMIAPFFADADLTRGGKIEYIADPNGQYFIARWDEIAYFGCKDGECDRRNSFQVILTDGKIRAIDNYILPLGANVVFVYGDMQWTSGSSSGGDNGFGGAPATVGLNKGDGETCDDYGIFDRDGFAYYGNHQDNACSANAVSHLDYHTIAFRGQTGDHVICEGEIMLRGTEANEGIELMWCTDVIDDTEFFVLERRAGADNAVYEEITTIYPNEPLALHVLLARLGDLTYRLIYTGCSGPARGNNAH